MSYRPKLVDENGIFYFVDSADQVLHSRKVMRLFERYRSYFTNLERLELSSTLNYVELTELIDKVNKKLPTELELDDKVQAFISQNKYAIKEQRVAGLTIKEHDKRWQTELEKFETILSAEITRPLKPQQVQASFFLTIMKRAANFSVPGAGKTAMMYGTFAYLSSANINEVDKMLVIAPLNAFEAWRTEFIAVFANKRRLHFLNLKDCTTPGDVRSSWDMANVIVLNYESLFGWKLSVLNELVTAKTMLVFDEVHRIKNPTGKRAQNALALGTSSSYRFVLTGTPIPNSYQDVYNFLHLLYRDEYNTFFGWGIPELEQPDTNEINKKLQPFFWRTNKADLQVPPAEPDKVIESLPDAKQQSLAETIHKVESSALSRYVRLLQASTNPELLTEKIDLNDLGFLDEESHIDLNAAFDNDEQQRAKQRIYLDLNVVNSRTPKFISGIKLIEQLVSEGKKVLVWGMFIGTMQKICQDLSTAGIDVCLIYGGTPKDQRVDLINNFRDGHAQVLVSNPATLGESISLHQTVHDAIYFEYNFNLTFMLQSRDRIHRLGLEPNQYTRYYYLMTEGDAAHKGFIDRQVYDRLKEKEAVMLNAIDGQYLLPEVTDSYLDDVKSILEN